MVTATQRATLIGVFDTPDDAHRAVEALHRAGFTNHQITMVMHHKDQEKTQVTDLDAAKAAQVTGETKELKGMALGAVAGGLLGGALAAAIVLVPGVGPIFAAGGLLTAAVLAGVGSGVVGGAVGGGLVGALVGLDFPEEEARLYERELKAGRILVGVKAGERAAEAHDILRLCGGRELEPESQPFLAPEQPFLPLVDEDR
jgi:hypothetical protein